MKPEALFHALCNCVDSPFSLDLWLRFTNSKNEFVERVINPKNYNDPATFALDYACYSSLRKYRGLDTGRDLKSVAISKFGNSEKTCALTNSYLRQTKSTDRIGRDELAILQRARQIISNVWGSPQFGHLFDRCGWGPGSTSSLRGVSATREDKMSQFPVSITPAAVPYFRQVVSTDYLWLRHLIKADVQGPTTLLPSCFELTSSSRLLTVPKDSRSDRTICAEPTANTFLQKGVGAYLRSRLKRFGVDLDDQKVNQSLARDAFTGGLATIDLSSASDHISIAVVKQLCPSEMFEVLNNLRSPSYRSAGREERFHKFSSMGNGFTFELESLIFFAVAKAVAEELGSEKPLGIYGDDIVCDARIADKLVNTLDALGFPVNIEKSFIKGNFFESCGKHYFKQYDVTPFYQKSECDGDPLEYMRMTNRFFDWCVRLYLQGLIPWNHGLWKIHNSLLRQAHPDIRSLTGFWFLEGDGFFRVRHDPLLSFDKNHGFTLKVLRPKQPKSYLADGGLYASEMRHASMSKSCTETTATLGFVTPRQEVRGFKRSRRRVQLFGRTAGLLPVWYENTAE